MMSSRGDLLSTAFAVGSLSGLFLYKQRARQHQGFAGQETGKAQEDARSDANSSLQWDRNRWDSIVEAFARRLLQSQKLDVDWPLLAVGDIQVGMEDVGSEDRNSKGIQIYTKTSVIENFFQLPPEKIVCNPSMEDSPRKTMEGQEEKVELEGNTNAQLDSESASNSSHPVNRMISATQVEELVTTRRKARASTPSTPDSTTSKSSNEKLVVTNSSKAQRRTIFGARVTKKYARQSSGGIPINCL